MSARGTHLPSHVGSSFTTAHRRTAYEGLFGEAPPASLSLRRPSHMHPQNIPLPRDEDELRPEDSASCVSSRQSTVPGLSRHSSTRHSRQMPAPAAHDNTSSHSRRSASRSGQQAWPDGNDSGSRSSRSHRSSSRSGSQRSSASTSRPHDHPPSSFRPLSSLRESSRSRSASRAGSHRQSEVSMSRSSSKREPPYESFRTVPSRHESQRSSRSQSHSRSQAPSHVSSNRLRSFFNHDDSDDASKISVATGPKFEQTRNQGLELSRRQNPRSSAPSLSSSLLSSTTINTRRPANRGITVHSDGTQIQRIDGRKAFVRDRRPQGGSFRVTTPGEIKMEIKGWFVKFVKHV